MANNSEREASPLKRADTIRVTVEEWEAWRKAAGLPYCWVIPPEALHDREELPGEEGLRAMPPFHDLSP
jgi:hypothetical protein